MPDACAVGASGANRRLHHAFGTDEIATSRATEIRRGLWVSNACGLEGVVSHWRIRIPTNCEYLLSGNGDLEDRYCSIHSSRLEMSRSNTTRVISKRAEIDPERSLSELDVIRLMAVAKANATANQTISIGRFRSAAQMGIMTTAISHQTAESFHEVNNTPSAGTEP